LSIILIDFPNRFHVVYVNEYIKIKTEKKIFNNTRKSTAAYPARTDISYKTFPSSGLNSGPLAVEFFASHFVAPTLMALGSS
jgi:hypothetical protein